jgi:hypothetical protein
MPSLDHRPSARRWSYIFGTAGLCALVALAAGRELSRRIALQDIARSSKRQDPLPGIVEPRIATVTNAAAGYVRDLEGIAVAYAAEADRLVDHDSGRFKTDLTLAEMTVALDVDRETIAANDGTISPDAPLFRAQSGVLTAEAKKLSRETRRKQASRGEKPWYVYSEWMIRHHVFTLNKLSKPSAEEKAILDAISRAALATPLLPGQGIRATAVERSALELLSAVGAGMLPVEAAHGQ